MQLAIELPDELGRQLLQQGNISQFVQEAVKKMLLEEQRAQAKNPLHAFEPTIATTASLPDEWIAENKSSHLPITQSLMGLLKGSNLDISDYKKHLEDKYL